MIKIIVYLLLVTASLTTMSCAAQEDASPTACPSRSADNYYFSPGALDPTNERSDAFVRDWYSKHLSAMDEPSISCGSPGEVYRFTWLRTFHHPVAVRITNHGTRVILQAIELDGAGGYEPGKVLRRTQKTLSVKEFENLTSAFSQAKFDLIPTDEKRDGLDGAEWIVETSSNDIYHLVVRWSPNSGPIREIGSRFLTLTGWKFDEVY